MNLLRVMAAALVLLAGTGPALAQQKRAPAPRWVDVVVKTPQGGYRQGNPNAPVKLVEYGSRTCPTCGYFAAQGVTPLRREWIATGKVSYEFRDYLVHGTPDFALALLNQCVSSRAFFPTLDAMFANQQAFHRRIEAFLAKSPELAERYEALPPAQAATRYADVMGAIAFMKTRGLPEAQARRCLASPALINSVAKTNAAAVTVHGVEGTPTFLINGRRVRALSWDQLQPELRAAAG